MTELNVFDQYNWKIQDKSYIYLTAAGFENRTTRGAELLASSKVPLAAAVVLEYRSPLIPENKPNLDHIIHVLKKKTSVNHIQVIQTGMLEQLSKELPTSVNKSRFRVIVDVTAMTHALILRSLRVASQLGEPPLVLYTEAKEYYPKRQDAKKYLKYADDEMAFDEASRQEQKEIMYAGLASIATVKGFEGRLIPTLPTTAILFPTFKRLRISGILSELEVNRRVFMIGKLVRSDLKWRERALRIINYDLIDPNTDKLVEVSTLSPKECLSKLSYLLKEGIVSPRGNIIICPHGSKMQTVGVWRFCVENPDVRVILSRPKEFFPKKYSTGYGDTFVFDPAVAWQNNSNLPNQHEGV